MSYKIAVCDDEKTMLRQISSYLEQWQRESGAALEPFFFSSAEELLQSMDRKTTLVLLDISMGGITGMECAKRLRAEGFSGEFIFITSMEDYAIEGYKVHAFAFLTKPLVYGELKNTLDEYSSKQIEKRQAVLPVDTPAGTRILRINSILYAEVYGRETSFILKDGSRVDSVIQLSSVEEDLAKYGFFRCHRSCLVSMKHITNISGTELTMADGSVVPLSKHRAKEFMSAYARFLKVELR